MTKPIPHKELLPPDAFCTVREAAKYAGCSEWTIREWAKRGLVKSARPFACGSSRLRIDTATLRLFVDPAS